jgi:hypothetical protein
MIAGQDPVVNYVVNNVWCAPYQDCQAIFKPARLTGYLGAQGSWKVLMTHTYLPDSTSRFHLFQIGYYHPVLIALLPKQWVWTRMSESCEALNGIVDVYFENGVRTITTECWYKVTEESNLIFAVRQIDEIGQRGGASTVHMGRDDLFVRIYRNAYFQNPARSTNDGVQYRSAHPASNSEVVTLQMNFDLMRTKPGLVYAFRNGYRIARVDLLTCKIGDWIETVYDPSIVEVVDVLLSSLPTFDSTLDSKGKYLVHTNDALEPTIRFHDDIDMFLLNLMHDEGVYQHKNTPNAMRMVTHQDYSIPVGMIASLIAANPSELLPFHDTILRMHIRDAGFTRPLVNEAQRIKELYKLPAPLVGPAMIGLNATVPVWQAAVMEAGPYAAAMSDATGKGVDRAGSVAALGYNAVVKLLAEPLNKTELFSGQLVARLPIVLTQNVSCFEYNSAGELSGWSWHEAGSLYNCAFTDTKYVEVIRGRYQDRMDEFYCQDAVLDAKHDWRHYVCEKNTPAGNWKDITGDSSKYAINAAGKITWACATNYYTLSRSNKQALVSSMALSMADGQLSFLVSGSRVVGGVVKTVPLEVPCGEIEVFLNKKTLILGLDYHVQWPRVMVVNKHYLKPGRIQDVVVRCTGVCTKDLGFTDANEFGFVVNNTLSVDNQYDVRDDKVLKVILGGGIRQKEELKYNEASGTFDLYAADNGKPYQVKDYVVPLKDYTSLDTQTFRAPSVVNDRLIGLYLTEKITQPKPLVINPITTLHRLYSPFLSKIIMDLVNGTWVLAGLDKQYSNNDVLDWVKPYEFWLDYDPIAPDQRPDANFTIIDPHCFSSPVTMSVAHYAFVNRVIRLYAPWMKLSTHAVVV